MSEIGNINNTTQPVKLQAKVPPKEASDIILVDGSVNSETVRPSETVYVQDISVKAPPKSVEESDDPLEKAAKIVEKYLPNEDSVPNTKLRIDRDESSGNFIYQSVDEISGEVIRQFPSEEILKVLSFYRELEGLAVDESA